MNIFHHKRNRYRFLSLAIATLMVLLTSVIPLRLAIAYSQSPIPQAILTLGGGREREQFTAHFAQSHPALEIWVSTGSPPEIAYEIFQGAGISKKRVHLDRRAVDTVTNFTSLVTDFKKLHIQHLYLITADFHMRRAKAIATLVLGSQGIAFTPVAFSWHEPAESWFHILRDCGRAILWIFTGRTGASLKLNIADTSAS
jgi:uncharacterized SAM-binding protein YcdF (DUF218 family)